MKRTTLISASLLLAFAGCTCGQGWRPNILTRLNNRIHGVSNVGEPCDAGCREAVMAAPVAHHGGCESCGNAGSVNYGGYEQMGDSYEVPAGTQFVGPSTQYVKPNSYPMGQLSGSRMEPIRSMPAN